MYNDERMADLSDQTPKKNSLFNLWQKDRAQSAAEADARALGQEPANSDWRQIPELNELSKPERDQILNQNSPTASLKKEILTANRSTNEVPFSTSSATLANFFPNSSSSSTEVAAVNSAVTNGLGLQSPTSSSITADSSSASASTSASINTVPISPPPASSLPLQSLTKDWSLIRQTLPAGVTEADASHLLLSFIQGKLTGTDTLDMAIREINLDPSQTLNSSKIKFLENLDKIADKEVNSIPDIAAKTNKIPSTQGLNLRLSDLDTTGSVWNRELNDLAVNINNYGLKKALQKNYFSQSNTTSSLETAKAPAVNTAVSSSNDILNSSTSSTATSSTSADAVNTISSNSIGSSPDVSSPASEYNYAAASQANRATAAETGTAENFPNYGQFSPEKIESPDFSSASSSYEPSPSDSISIPEPNYETARFNDSYPEVYDSGISDFSPNYQPSTDVDSSSNYDQSSFLSSNELDSDPEEYSQFDNEDINDINNDANNNDADSDRSNDVDSDQSDEEYDEDGQPISSKSALRQQAEDKLKQKGRQYLADKTGLTDKIANIKDPRVQNFVNQTLGLQPKVAAGTTATAGGSGATATAAAGAGTAGGAAGAGAGAGAGTGAGAGAGAGGAAATAGSGVSVGWIILIVILVILLIIIILLLAGAALSYAKAQEECLLELEAGATESAQDPCIGHSVSSSFTDNSHSQIKHQVKLYALDDCENVQAEITDATIHYSCTSGTCPENDNVISNVSTKTFDLSSEGAVSFEFTTSVNSTLSEQDNWKATLQLTLHSDYSTEKEATNDSEFVDAGELEKCVEEKFSNSDWIDWLSNLTEESFTDSDAEITYSDTSFTTTLNQVSLNHYSSTETLLSDISSAISNTSVSNYISQLLNSATVNFNSSSSVASFLTESINSSSLDLPTSFSSKDELTDFIVNQLQQKTVTAGSLSATDEEIVQAICQAFNQIDPSQYGVYGPGKPDSRINTSTDLAALAIGIMSREGNFHLDAFNKDSSKGRSGLFQITAYYYCPGTYKQSNISKSDVETACPWFFSLEGNIAEAVQLYREGGFCHWSTFTTKGKSCENTNWNTASGIVAWKTKYANICQ